MCITTLTSGAKRTLKEKTPTSPSSIEESVVEPPSKKTKREASAYELDSCEQSHSLKPAIIDNINGNCVNPDDDEQTDKDNDSNHGNEPDTPESSQYSECCAITSSIPPKNDSTLSEKEGYEMETPICEVENRGRRTLYLDYWTRTDECKERKWDHLDEIDALYSSREDHIFATTLKGRSTVMEPNMFPYDTPSGVEHWTLWSVYDMQHYDVQDYVEQWITKNAPHIERWNYDDNPERSIDIFHVHVYLQVGSSDSVLQDRQVEDLDHDWK